MKRALMGWLALVVCLGFGCDSGGGGGGGGGEGGEGGGGGMDAATDSEVQADAGPDTGPVVDMAVDMARPMERPIEERCPDAQAGTFLLVLFPDRIDAYRQRDFGASYFCEFLALADNGITHATGFAIDRDGTTIYVVQPEEGKGSVYAFDTNGRFQRKVQSNVNLDGVEGIWNTFGERFVVWSALSQNLYELESDGTFRTQFVPPNEMGSLARNLTDLVFIDQETMIATFSDRPAKLYKRPFSPSWDAAEVGPGNAVAAVETEEGIKVLMTAQVGGAGNGYGVLLYEAVLSGRAVPDLEQVLVPASEDVVDGIDLMVLELGVGFMVMD
ncbi:MAG: hypothetical protein KC620_03780, partial [Myxococcales bacterium]|nr:hypothetical protein [Myxococcales bacterium]